MQAGPGGGRRRQLEEASAGGRRKVAEDLPKKFERQKQKIWRIPGVFILRGGASSVGQCMHNLLPTHGQKYEIKDQAKEKDGKRKQKKEDKKKEMFVNRKSPKVYFETASILSNVCGNGFEAGGCYMESGETTQCAHSNIERTQSERKVRCDFSFETIVCKEDCGTQRFLDFTFSKKWGI